MTIQILEPTDKAIELAVQRLKDGFVIGLPTETVYGLAADASNPVAVNRIYKAKDRPNNHPLIVHVRQAQENEDWLAVLAPWAREVCPPAFALAQAFWPGPLTMILPRAKGVIDEVTGGLDTVGIRCPNHPVAQAILKSFKGGLAAPSANRFGRISPTAAQHVKDEFLGHLDELIILDGGSCSVGIESTIVDFCHWDPIGPIILRPGLITQNQVEITTGLRVGEKPAITVRHSGGMAAHYAPRTVLFLANDVSKHLTEQHLDQAPPSSLVKIAWVSMDRPQFPQSSSIQLEFYPFPRTPSQAAQILYQLLRDLDAQSYTHLVFPELPATIEWAGIRDRLGRAAVGSGT